MPSNLSGIPEDTAVVGDIDRFIDALERGYFEQLYTELEVGARLRLESDDFNYLRP